MPHFYNSRISLAVRVIYHRHRLVSPNAISLKIEREAAVRKGTAFELKKFVDWASINKSPEPYLLPDVIVACGQRNIDVGVFEKTLKHFRVAMLRHILKTILEIAIIHEILTGTRAVTDGDNCSGSRSHCFLVYPWKTL